MHTLSGKLFQTIPQLIERFWRDVLSGVASNVHDIRQCEKVSKL